MIDKYINFNNIISFNISINIINYSIDYVYYIKYTMNNIKKYKKITIKFSKIILLIIVIFYLKCIHILLE